VGGGGGGGGEGRVWGEGGGGGCRTTTTLYVRKWALDFGKTLAPFPWGGWGGEFNLVYHGEESFQRTGPSGSSSF